MRVAFVTTADPDAVHDDVDVEFQRAAFARAGHELLEWAWEDETVDWTSPDLVIIRSPWNWTSHVDEFLGWLDRVDTSRLHNPAAVVRWNLDKRYLADLAALGVPVVPTEYVDDEQSLDRALAALHGECVIKPTVSAGSRLTGRFVANDVRARALGLEILAEGLEVMVQPHVAGVATVGEVGTVCFDGVISHSFTKGPILAAGGGFVTGAYEERITAHVLADDERDLVERAMRATHEACRGHRLIDDRPLLYARIDTVRLDDGSVAVLELEAFEPCFFLPVDLDAADRFVRAVEDRV